MSPCGPLPFVLRPLLHNSFFVRKSSNQPNHSVAQLFVNVHFVPVSNEKAATLQPTHQNQQRKTKRLMLLATLSTSSSQRYATDFQPHFMPDRHFFLHIAKVQQINHTSNSNGRFFCRDGACPVLYLYVSSYVSVICNICS